MTATTDFRGNGRFALGRRLGAGGMGVVFQALDREHGAEVALKTLKYLDAAAIYHLKQEFRALADVRHANLVRLHELVSDGEHWFFTMELVDGVDFLQHVRNEAPRSGPRTEDPVSDGSLEPPARLSLSPLLEIAKLREALKQVIEGVAAIHKAGHLHRDVKPSNVLVRGDGRVVILDFGLATPLRGRQTLESIEQHALGTPEYVSPEQGAARPLTPASDWYSVGVMLFEALTGGLPFLGSSLEILMAKERDDGPAPGQFVAGIPEDLDRLCAALLRRRPQDRPGTDEILRAVGVGSVSDEPPPRNLSPSVMPVAPVFVGRSVARTSLDLAFRRSRQGRAVMVRLHGGAGVGKSSLVRSFLDDATVRHNAVVLAGACFEREMVPFKAIDSVIDALTRHLRRRSRLQVEALLPREIRALSRLFPVLERVEAIAAAPPLAYESPDRAEARRRAFSALRELLARIADRRPLVVSIEDLQWGDDDSVALLGDLLRPPYPPPFLLLTSYRDEIGNPTLDAFKALHLEDRGGSAASEVVDLRASSTARRRRRTSACEVHEVPLGPLTDEEARDLSAALLEEAQVSLEHVAEIVDSAEGNPLLVVELVGWLREHPAERLLGTKASVDAVVQERLGHASAPGRRLVETAAIAGQPLPAALLSQAAGVDADRDTLQRLFEQRLLRPIRGAEGDRVVTFHERVRSSILERLAADAVAEGHLRIAHAIEKHNADDAEALAEHFRLAGAKWRASRYAAKAATRAQEALAFRRAAVLFRTAIELAPPNAPELTLLRVQLGDVLAAAGYGVEAAHAYLAAAEDAPPEERLDLHRRAAQQLLHSGHIDDGLGVFAGVLTSIGESSRPESPRWTLAQLLLRRAQLRLRGLEFEERSEAEVEPMELARIDTFWALATGLSMVNTAAGADLATRHTLLALRTGEPYRVARAFASEGSHSALGGSVTQERTERLVRLLVPLAARVGNPHTDGLAESLRGHQAHFLGRFVIGRTHYEAAERIFRERCAGVAWELANTRVCLIAALANLGELRELSDRVPLLLEEADTRGDLLAMTNLRVGHGSLAWAVHDDPVNGRKDVRDALRHWSQRAFLLQHYFAMASLSWLDLYGGDTGSAYRRLEKRWPDLERSLLLRVQRIRVEALHLRAMSALAAKEGEGRLEARLRLAEQCARKIEGEALPWADPMAWTIRAALAQHADADSEAITQLRRAVAGFEGVDMKLHAAAARRRLGVLVGGDEGRRMIAATDAWMGAEDVQDPVRMTAMVLPAFR